MFCRWPLADGQRDVDVCNKGEHSVNSYCSSSDPIPIKFLANGTVFALIFRPS